MEIARNNDRISISQRKCVVNLLTKIGMLECSTSVEPRQKPRKLWDDTPTNRLRHQKLVGKLIYLSHSKPNIYYHVSFISQFMHDTTNGNLQGCLENP